MYFGLCYCILNTYEHRLFLWHNHCEIDFDWRYIMSEMLGNQYFLARTFDKALIQFEHVIDVEPENEKVKKKLIICYCEVGKVEKALNLFKSVIETNIVLITETDIVDEDCPCPDIIKRLKWYEQVTENSFDFNCVVGILNLYCNIEESYSYFTKAIEYKPKHKLLQSVIDIISSHSKNIH